MNADTSYVWHREHIAEVDEARWLLPANTEQHNT